MQFIKKNFFSDNFFVLNIVKISETTPFCKITEKLTEESNHFEEHITTEKLDQNTIESKLIFHLVTKQSFRHFLD